MSLSVRILVSRLVLAAGAVTLVAVLAGCGQKGPLFLPKEPAAARRATLPEILSPIDIPSATRPAPPASATRP
ncbi:MAG: hypothetical protein CVU30_01345 [Betaproteobacteria bacterium HGW-Betaproteobacteria-3]|jgi:predicted small lipoprotein YifL|nr:MAG: hypothetical protein CVU30_01345 [Betaproteobacteria bacterium HGW-Betaproteobacteria-3]